MSKQDSLQNMLKELDSLIKEERSRTIDKKPLKEEIPEKKISTGSSTKIEDYANFFGGSKSRKSDGPIIPSNQRYATHEDLQRNYTDFLGKVQTQLASLGGGGSYELMDNRDVVRQKASMLDDRSILIFNSAIQKFEPKTLSNSLSETEQITASTQISQFETNEKFIGVNSASPATLDLVGIFSEGQKLIIKDKSGTAATNNITINSSDLIDEANTVTIAINWGSVTLLRNNNTWSII